MKATSTHFVLEKGSDYKDLAPVFEDILTILLEEIEQVPEDEEIMGMFIEQNLSDLNSNRKPEGYNRKGRIRLVFPMDRKEFYLKTYSKNADLAGLSDRISSMLKEANVKFSVLQNDNMDFE